MNLESLTDRISNNPFFGQAFWFCFNQLESVENLAVIEMGCGKGLESVFFALHGARVIGFDTNETDLAKARQLAFQCNVQDRCAFICCDAERVAISTGAADLIFSQSTLQYMNKEVALDQCLRILKTGGTLVLIQNLPNNPFIRLLRLYRKWREQSPQRIAYVKSIRGYLTLGNIYMLKPRFSALTSCQYHLFRVLTIALRNRLNPCPSWIDALDTKLSKVDNFVLAHFPFSSRFAWFVGIVGKEKRDSN